MSNEIVSSHDSFDHITDHSLALYCLAGLIDAVDLSRLDEEVIMFMPELLRTIGAGIGNSVENARNNLCFFKAAAGHAESKAYSHEANHHVS